MMPRLRNAPPRYWLVLIAVVFFLGFPTVISSFQSSLWAQALILAIAVMGLNILVGYSGQLSLGHGAFMALGAYTSAILAHRYKMDYLLTIPIAALFTGLVGFLFGFPALRLSPLYLALATFALAVVTPSLIKRPEGLTGGVQGIILIQPDPPPFASDLFAAVTGTAMTSDQWIYYVSLFCALLLFWVAWNILRRRPGRAMRAIRDGEVAAAASGVISPPTRRWPSRFRPSTPVPRDLCSGWPPASSVPTRFPYPFPSSSLWALWWAAWPRSRDRCWARSSPTSCRSSRTSGSRARRGSRPRSPRP